MKLTVSQLRRIIKEEVEQLRGKQQDFRPEVQEVISQMQANKSKWEMVKDEFIDMANGRDAEGIRQQYYPNWSDKDFYHVCNALGFNPYL